MNETIGKIFAVIIILLLIAVFGIDGEAFTYEIEGETYVCMTEADFDRVLEVMDELDVCKETKAEVVDAWEQQEARFLETLEAEKKNTQAAYWRGFGTGAGVAGGVVVVITGVIVTGVLLSQGGQ